MTRLIGCSEYHRCYGPITGVAYTATTLVCVGNDGRRFLESLLAKAIVAMINRASGLVPSISPTPGGAAGNGSAHNPTVSCAPSHRREISVRQHVPTEPLPCDEYAFSGVLDDLAADLSKRGRF
jgi:uncharacterized SAM-binding protein YcdF (DUF218 family)